MKIFRSNGQNSKPLLREVPLTLNYAITLLSKSEYSPVGLIKALQKLSKGDTMPQWLEILSTHPHLDERVSNLIKQV